MTQRSALIGLLTLPLTDWEGLDQRRLIPNPAHCIKESSFRVVAPKISQNLPSCRNQQSNEKEFFHRILIIYWLSRWPIVNNMNWIVVTQSGHYDTVALGSPNAMGLNGRERVTRPIIVHVKVTTWSFKKEIHFFRPIHECKSCCLFRDWIRRVTSEGSPPLDLIRPFSLSFYKLHHRAKRKPTKGGISEKPLHVLKPSSWLNI